MIKYGCMALVAMACSAVAPAAQAQGNFFIGGQVGQAEYGDSGLDDDSADTRAFNIGYRWAAGPIVQVGFEAGLGTVDEVSGDIYYYSDGSGYVETGRGRMEADYRNLGANARFNFGKDSRWFAIARAGYMAYEMDAHAHYEARYNGELLDTMDLSASDDGGGAYFGAGIGLDVTQNFNINVMYNGYAYSDFESDSYEEAEIGTAATTTLGIEVRF